ncbi:MAG: type II secretion system protein [Firmicutes bacterium]|nr:type II secretion system protein [Bacillota bacterium]
MNNCKKGFSLAELLIVVAIIAVLVAVAIPIFTSQLEKSREATDAANIRSYYSEFMAAIISNDFNSSFWNQEESIWKTDAIDLKQKHTGWETSSIKESLEKIAEVEGTPDEPQVGGTAWLEYKDVKLTLHYGQGSSGIALTPEQQVKQQLENYLTPTLAMGDINTDLGKMIVSNKPENLNAALQAVGYQGSAYITNGTDKSKYAINILYVNGISSSDPKIVTVTADGKGLTEHNVGDESKAVQYLYYKTKVDGKDKMVLFGTREVTITVKELNKDNKVQKMEFDTSDASTGSTWTKVS